jgi:hypothetical protein
MYPHCYPHYDMIESAGSQRNFTFPTYAASFTGLESGARCQADEHV